MRRANVLAVCVGLCVIVVGGSLAEAQSQSDGQGLLVRRRPDQRLPEVGRPEETVIVEDWRDPPLFVSPGPEDSWASWHTNLADVVMLVKVRATLPFLTPGEDWVRSITVADVVEVLKGPDDYRPIAQVFVFEDGGELQHGTKRIVARLPRTRMMKVGQRYLLFGGVGSEGDALSDPRGINLLASPELTYEVTASERLDRLGDRDQQLKSDGFQGRELSAVIEQIKRVLTPAR